MTTPSTSTSDTSSSTTGAGSALTSNPPVAGGLDASQGKTTIADAVVSKVARIAAGEVSGVHGFGGGAARAFGAITERIPGGRPSSTQGVSVEVGERQAAIDLTIVVEYGVSVADLARAIRRNVIGAVEQMTGLQVVEVNINVTDLHLPGDDSGDSDNREQDSAPTNRVQ